MNGDTWRSARPLIVAGLVLLGVVLLLVLLVQLRQIAAVLFLSVVVGVALNPIADFLSRARIPGIVAVLLVYAVVAAALAGFSYYAAVEIANEDFNFEIESLKADYEDLRDGTPLPSSDEIEDGLRSVVQSSAGGVVTGAMTLLSGLLLVFTGLFSALLFSITQDRMREIVISFFPPEHRPRANEVLGKLAKGLRGFVVGELAAMFTIGIVTYLGLLVLGVDFPLLLAFLAFLFEILPLIGPWIAFVPAVIIAVTDSLLLAVQVSVLYLLIQGFENYIVTPVVHGRESKVPALLILVALLIGGSLMGLLGALVALPIAVSLHILFFELVMPWNERRYAGQVETTTADEPEPVAIEAADA